MIRVYLAGPFDHQEALRDLRDQCGEDVEITSRWLDFEPGLDDEATDHYRSLCATVDLADVDRADVLIQFTNGAVGTGGRHVELGYAIAKGKRVIVVGEHENIFHWHPDVTLVKTFEDALELL